MNTLQALSLNNIYVLLTGATAIVLIGVLWALPYMDTPAVATRFGRQGAMQQNNSILDRLWGEAQRFRTSGQTPVLDNVRVVLIGDGGQIRQSADLKLLLGIVSMFVSLLLFLFVAFLGGFPLFFLPFVAAFGFLLPRLLVAIYNDRRRRRVLSELPDLCLRMQRFSRLTRNPIEVFRNCVELGEGPLYDEFRRALDTMNRAPEPWSALRDIDRRNDIHLFTGLANKLEWAMDTGAQEVPEIFKELTDNVITEREHRLEERAGQMVLKLSLVMTPFLLPAVLLSAAGVAILSFLGVAPSVLPKAGGLP